MKLKENESWLYYCHMALSPFHFQVKNVSSCGGQSWLIQCQWAIKSEKRFWRPKAQKKREDWREEVGLLLNWNRKEKKKMGPGMDDGKKEEPNERKWEDRGGSCWSDARKVRNGERDTNVRVRGKHWIKKNCYEEILTWKQV